MKRLDTANDYRILVAEDAVERLERRIRSWSLPWPIRKKDLINEVERLRKTLLKIKYSYLPAEMLAISKEMDEVVRKAKELVGVLMNREGMASVKEVVQKLALAEIRYALGILIGLPNRIRLGEENRPEYAVDVVGAEVSRVEKLTDRLKVTRASAGSFALTVVTNLKDIKVGEVRAVAILPPAEFYGVVSEAMYSSDPIERRYVGRRVPSRLLSSELRARVIDLVGRRR